MSRACSSIVLFLIAPVLFVACGSSPDRNSNAGPRNAAEAARSGEAATAGTPASASGMSAIQACYEVNAGEKKVLRSQTFAIDFAPFKNSCFVTSHDPEFNDPPLNSEIAIYRDGKKVPGALRGAPDWIDVEDDDTGLSKNSCWVEAVAFQDVNGDGLTDVVVVAKCGAKSGPYSENLVYINNNKLLFTRPDVNVELNNFKTIREIVQFAKDNPGSFSVTRDASSSNSKS